MSPIPFQQLQAVLQGDLLLDNITKTIYATDASDFKEFPLAVCFPKNEQDIQHIVLFANTHHISLIPRAAGTSLAGQVVGNGLVVDISRYMTQIIEVNIEEKWARVQPGVVRDELNLYLKPLGLMFGPETSTANRATIGGMVGNNACGANSIVYGSTREHLIASRVVLSNGDIALFEPLSQQQLQQKKTLPSLEGQIYSQTLDLLQDPLTQKNIFDLFPKPSIKRRNTGYALDILCSLQPFNPNGDPFNFSKLLAGSEGTLAFSTELKINLLPLPPAQNALLCIHCSSLQESLLANIECVAFNPYSLELIDHYILDCTKNNREYQAYNFFVHGNPHAILIAEFRFDHQDQLDRHIQHLIQHLQTKKMGYHYAIVQKQDVQKVWALRKAGLGLLANIPGDDKAVAVIEDTAVDILDLPNYIQEFNALLKKYNLFAVHYAHVGTGELHLRPLLNLKSSKGQQLYRTIAQDIASLVKKYRGSLSGEHGDGRLRGEFLEQMVGTQNYNLFLQTKNIWDKNLRFNPHKIVHTPKMDESLRYIPDYNYPVHKTLFRFSQGDILRDIQQCNGSGDCRKSHLSGGTMCPSFMATKDEHLTTRARANVLRETLSNKDALFPFDNQEALQILDLCLSCKGCKSECPSNVDMAKFKAEFLYQYYKNNPIPLRSRLIAHFSNIMAWASVFPPLYNLFSQAPLLSTITKKILGFAPQRSLPKIASYSLKKWHKKWSNLPKNKTAHYHSQVFFFCDEFSNYLDVQIGKKTILLLHHLGYKTIIPQHAQSGRSFFSKGFLKKAQHLANTNVQSLASIVSAQSPLIGIEPSCILSFRDEYPDLVSPHLLQQALSLSKNTFLIDEFLLQEIQKGKISPSQFSQNPQPILFHAHCQQKAIAKPFTTLQTLKICHPNVSLIPSGCCGMAGSFGYEKEHFDLSQKIGNLVLFPTIQNKTPDALVVAYGTSCRHQIKDATTSLALHPIEVLWQQLIKP